MRKLDDNTANRLKSTSVSCSYAVGLHWFGIGAASGHITTTFSSMMLHTPSTDFGEILSSIIARVNAVVGPSQSRRRRRDATPVQVGVAARAMHRFVAFVYQICRIPLLGNFRTN